ncbi:MAG: cyclase family protein [Rhodothermales bacterium]
MLRNAIASLVVLVLAAGCQPPAPSDPFAGEWIDLSYAFSDETLYWPTAEPFRIDTVSAGVTEAGFYYSAFAISTAEHGGTHLDAPVHFAEGKQSTEQIPLKHTIGPAFVIDVSDKALADRDYQIGVDDVTAWEARHGQLPDKAILLFRTGYGRYWPDAQQYMGTTLRGAEGVANLHFPGIHPETARWLLANRYIHAVGIDTPSIDFGQSTLFETHQTLFAENVAAFENVANLDQLPEVGAFVVALPMKIKGGSGGPLRIVAHVPAGE